MIGIKHPCGECNYYHHSLLRSAAGPEYQVSIATTTGKAAGGLDGERRSGPQRNTEIFVAFKPYSMKQ